MIAYNIHLKYAKSLNLSESEYDLTQEENNILDGNSLNEIIVVDGNESKIDGELNGLVKIYSLYKNRIVIELDYPRNLECKIDEKIRFKTGLRHNKEQYIVEISIEKKVVEFILPKYLYEEEELSVGQNRFDISLEYLYLQTSPTDQKRYEVPQNIKTLAELKEFAYLILKERNLHHFRDSLNDYSIYL